MQQPSVLIVDDSEMERYMLSRQLKIIGISTITQKSGALSALEFLKDHAHQKNTDGNNLAPELIILDVNMPTMDGFEFLQAFSSIAAQAELTHCKILMYSGSESIEEQNKALECQFVKGFLIKGSISTNELKSVIAGL